MKTLKVTLKQHTPLIHFQHDQHGATLRVSEVKPKLDKYIIRHAFNGDFDECKSYLIGYDDKKPDALREKFGQGYRALNYKMRIIPCGKKDVSLKVYGPDKDDVYETACFPMLLSNMGGKNDPSQLNNLVFYDHLVMTIAVKADRLHKEIDGYIAKFFANVNLGQRTSKGFGSFTVREIDDKLISWKEFEYYDEGCPLMSFDLESSISPKLKHLAIFSVIDFYWKCLKPGINYTRDKKYPKRYIKSFLYHYMNDYLTPARTWEKREIKQYFNLPKQIREVPPNPNPYVFARAMLGCPDKYSYGSREVKVSHIEGDDNKKIDRIPAPIYFKPVCFSNQVCIYVLFDSSVVDRLNEVKSRKFSMTYNHRSLNMNIDLFLNKDNYMRFIESYHEYLSFDTDVNDAVYEGEDRLDYIEAEGFGVVPRSFDWKNLLEEGGYVDFGNVNTKVE